MEGGQVMARADRFNHNFAPARTDWCTPSEVLNPLREFAPIDLDPCSNANSIVGAEQSISLPGDGLADDWICGPRSIVYCNPPYGRQIGPWIQKCALVGSGNGNVVALIPASTDTRWWHNHVAHAAAICFWRGRLKFVGAEAGAKFPSALVLWTWREVSMAARFRQIFSAHGHVMVPA